MEKTPSLTTTEKKTRLFIIIIVISINVFD